MVKSRSIARHEIVDIESEFVTESDEIVRICTECPLPANKCRYDCRRFREMRDKIRGYSYGKNKQKKD